MFIDQRPLAVLRFRVIGAPLPTERFPLQSTAFTLSVPQGLLEFLFTEPPYSGSEAERRVAEFLTSFEGDLLLQGAPGRRQFLLDSGEYCGGGGFQIGVYGTASVGGPQAEANSRRLLPWRYHRYRDDDFVSALITRYEEYRRGHEKLLVMAFFCLSALETSFGGRALLAKALNVEKAVLSRLGELVSTHGTLLTARKVSQQHTGAEPSETELAWLEWITRELIARTGQVRSPGIAPAFGRLTLIASHSRDV